MDREVLPTQRVDTIVFGIKKVANMRLPQTLPTYHASSSSRANVRQAALVRFHIRSMRPSLSSHASISQRYEGCCYLPTCLASLDLAY